MPSIRIELEDGRISEGGTACFAWLGGTGGEAVPGYEFSMKDLVGLKRLSFLVSGTEKDAEFIFNHLINSNYGFLKGPVKLTECDGQWISCKVDVDAPYYEVYTCLKLIFKPYTLRERITRKLVSSMKAGMTYPEAYVGITLARMWGYSYPLADYHENQKKALVEFLKGGEVNWDEFGEHVKHTDLPFKDKVASDHPTYGSCRDNPLGYNGAGQYYRFSTVTTDEAWAKGLDNLYKQLFEKQVYV